MGKKLKITLTKSTIARSKSQRATIASLGLRKINHTTIKEDSPTVRGMITRVGHLVTVEEID